MYSPNERIQQVNITDEMKNAYIDYSMSVIIGRALPDVRDGLKVGNRRILYAMRELGLVHNRPFSKCAKVVGKVIGEFHPHGDGPVYDTLVRMAQDFAYRYPLVDGQGNFGSIDGDPPAAYRYTECRLRRMAEEMLAEIDRDTVDFQPTFDEEQKEPIVLPARIPNLLVNGATGIAVGMATNIPPHNLGEVIDAVCHLIDHPNASLHDLLRIVPGPDFPTGGQIIGTGPIRQAYETGRGIVRLRGKVGIEETRQGREQIIITEVPYNVSPSDIETKIADLVNNKKIEGIADVRNETNREGVRLVLELKRGAIARVIVNQIFKFTPLESTFGIIMLALDHNRPRLMNLRELLECFLDHRREVVVRRTRYDLARAEERAHILEGFKIALDNLDDFVRIIRASKDRKEARVRLMEKYELSRRQADAILEMRLYQLTGLEREKIDAEYLELIRRIERFRTILASPAMLDQIVRDELQEMKNRYGDERRTEILPAEGEIGIEDLIANETCLVTMTHSGYIKRTAAGQYRAQRRGGRGVRGAAMREEDFVEQLFVASTHDDILFFTAAGRVYRKKVYEIPEGSRSSRGKAIVNLLEISRDEKIAAMIRVTDFEQDRLLFMATRNGTVKKTPISAFQNIRRTGIIAIDVVEGDALITVLDTSGDDDVVLVTRDGYSIRFHEEDVREMGRVARGVRGIQLRGDDRVVAAVPVRPDATLLVATENGYGKRTAFEDYRVQRRGGMGIITVRTTERNGKVVGALDVRDGDEFMLMTEGGMSVRTRVSEFRVIGRNTQGVRLIDLKEGDRLTAIARIISTDEDSQQSSDEETAPTGGESATTE